MGLTLDSFDFETQGEEEVAVNHGPTSSTWRFRVEHSQGRRILVPRRARDLPPATKGMSVIKKAAFEHAVARSRTLDIID